MNKRTRGFTLLEVMVAVAVFAVAGAALIKNASLTVNQTISIRDKTLAYWVAENELGELRSEPRDPATFPGAGTSRHTVSMADRSWDVVIDIENTDNKDMRRIEVNVHRPEDPDQSLATLVSFLGRY